MTTTPLSAKEIFYKQARITAIVIGLYVLIQVIGTVYLQTFAHFSYIKIIIVVIGYFMVANNGRYIYLLILSLACFIISIIGFLTGPYILIEILGNLIYFLIGIRSFIWIRAWPFEGPEIIKINPDDFKHQVKIEGVDPERLAMREKHYCMLGERRFKCNRALPLYRSEKENDQLRPVKELAARLLALYGLFQWVSAPEEIIKSESINSFFQRNTLKQYLTLDDIAIKILPRSEAKKLHIDTIGWRLENIWALAWILGFDSEPPFYKGQIPKEIMTKILEEFIPNLNVNLSTFIAKLNPRSGKEVGQLEDLYYCTHNAIRSAQMGGETVPLFYNPINDGKAVHERRHALTWALTPGTTWDETDLST